MTSPTRSRPPLAARLPKVPQEADFTSPLRGVALTARVGTWLGLAIGVCFVTGLISHWSQLPTPAIPVPTRPSWGYRLTQGLHVLSGTAAVPLLLVKLWAVFPAFFARPGRGGREVIAHAAGRLSIGLLVAAAIFELASGLANIAHWYPSRWGVGAFSFRRTHYAVAWLLTGALLFHLAAKWPAIRRGWREGIERPATGESPAEGAESPPPTGGLSRRGLLRTTQAAAGLAVVATAGGTIPWLREIGVLSVRSGSGPQGIPVNKTAASAGVIETASAADFRLTIRYGDRLASLSRADLLALPQHTVRLPIACVEGWSATGLWTGVRLSSLLALVEAPADREVEVSSLQERGPFRNTLLPAAFAADPLTLLALSLGGEPLSLDHGFPCRLIAPNRPGVLQTKWVTGLEVAA